MASKKLTLGGAIAFIATGFGIIFKESVGWVVGKVLDLLPLPKNPSGAVNWAVIPWLNILAIALLLLGVFLFWIGGRMKSSEVMVADQPHKQITAKAYRIARTLSSYRSTRSYSRTYLPELLPIVREGLSLLMSFEKAGFSIPRLATNDTYSLGAALHHYFGAIAPLLNEGHVDDAKTYSETISEKADSICEDLPPHGFWTPRD